MRNWRRRWNGWLRLERRSHGPPGFVKRNRPQRKGAAAAQAADAKHNTSRQQMTPTAGAARSGALSNMPVRAAESLDYTREVIELPPPQAVEVIEHQVVKRWCPCCAAWRSRGWT